MPDDVDRKAATPDDPLADDPAFAAWPVAVRQAWAALELPSLHDLLAAQERLAAEVRRQNQELRRLAQAAASPAPAGPTEDVARALAEAQRLGGRLASAAAAGLIACAESADRHALALEAATQAILAQAAGRDWLGRPRAWPVDLRQALTAQVDGARLVRDKARQALADAGLVRLAPRAGDPFDPDAHHCLGTAPGTPGRVLRCEHEGWLSGATLLRPAEVIIGAADDEIARIPGQAGRP